MITRCSIRSAGKLPRRCPGPQLQRGGPSSWLPAVHDQPAHPQAGGAGRASFVRARHPLGGADRGRRGDEGIRPVHPRHRRPGHPLLRRLALRGRLRFGASEDFVSSRLPELLGDFVRQHPLVDLALTVEMSATLYQMLDAGELDLVLCKRRAGDERGRLVWRDRLAWIGTEAARIDPAQPLPLILYTPPSITRTAALETLERAGRPWRIVCSSGSLSGLRAAALAGLGVTGARAWTDARGALGDGRRRTGFPDLGDVEFIVLGAMRQERGPAAELSAAILANGGRLQRRSAM